MTERQFDKYAERLSDRHGLSLQLTSGWLRDGGYDKLSPSGLIRVGKPVRNLEPKIES